MYSITTAAGREYLSAAAHNEGKLYDVYNSCSRAKRRAWDAIIREAEQDPNAGPVHVCGHSTFSFSCAYETLIADDDTSELIPVYIYYTANNMRRIAIDR